MHKIMYSVTKPYIYMERNIRIALRYISQGYYICLNYNTWLTLSEYNIDIIFPHRKDRVYAYCVHFNKLPLKATELGFDRSGIPAKILFMVVK